MLHGGSREVRARRGCDLQMLAPRSKGREPAAVAPRCESQSTCHAPSDSLGGPPRCDAKLRSTPMTGTSNAIIDCRPVDESDGARARAHERCKAIQLRLVQRAQSSEYVLGEVAKRLLPPGFVGFKRQ